MGRAFVARFWDRFGIAVHHLGVAAPYRDQSGIDEANSVRRSGLPIANRKVLAQERHSEWNAE